MNDELRKRITDAILVPVLAIFSGLLVGAVLIALSGKPPLEAFRVLFETGFGCQDSAKLFGNESFNCSLLVTLDRSTPIILTGLSAVVAFRSGMFSIGQEGQFLAGAIVAAWLGYQIQLPPVIHPIFIFVVAMIAGGFYGYIPGVLKVKLGVNEIISTIVLNTIAALFTAYVVNFPLRADQSSIAHSHVVHESAQLFTFFQGYKWGIGWVIALSAAVIIFIYLWRSVPGYEQRMAGQSPQFALFGGIKSDRAAIRAMIISGALSGLAGSIEVLGNQYRIMQGFELTGLGFDGLSVAILGQAHPVGVVIVGLLLAGIQQGAQLGLQFSVQIPRELGGVVLGLMILFVSMENFYKSVIARIRKLLGQDNIPTQAEEAS